MKKLLLTLTAAAMIFSGCSSERDDIPQMDGNVLGLCKVQAETSDDSAVEIQTIGQEGFKLYEYESSTGKLLQQSVWKELDNNWTPVKPIEAVASDKISAVYPIVEKQEDGKVVLKAGVNNMTALTTIDRAKTNQAEIEFKHQMCQISYNFKDNEGNIIPVGEENGMITKVIMVQPSQMTYNLLTGETEIAADMTELQLSSKTVNYIIPGAEGCEFKVDYKDSEGTIHKFTCKPEDKFVKNKKYDLDFTMDPATRSLAGITIRLENWN